MADKRIFRNVKNRSGAVIALFDARTNKFIPLDPENSDYQTYLLLVDQGSALALDAGAPLPNGVTDADVQPRRPKLGIEPPHEP